MSAPQHCTSELFDSGSGVLCNATARKDCPRHIDDRRQPHQADRGADDRWSSCSQPLTVEENCNVGSEDPMSAIIVPQDAWSVIACGLMGD